MALTFEEQRLYDFAKGSLPAWIKNDDEFLHGAAKMFGSVRAMVDSVAFRPPFALFGHSLGAVVAFETARALLFRDPIDAHAFLLASGVTVLLFTVSIVVFHATEFSLTDHL